MYNYQWNDVLSKLLKQPIGLCVDEITNNTVYTCVITDALGCTTTETYNLSQSENLKYQLSNQVIFRVMMAVMDLLCQQTVETQQCIIYMEHRTNYIYSK